MQAILLGALFAWWALPTAIKVCYAIFKYIEPPSSDPPKRQAPEPEPEPTPESPPQPPQPRDYMPIIFDQLNDPARRAIDKKDGSIYLKVDLSLLTEGEKCAAWVLFEEAGYLVHEVPDAPIRGPKHTHRFYYKRTAPISQKTLDTPTPQG